MPAEPWDDLFDAIDHLAGDPGVKLDADVEQRFAALCTQAIEAGEVDPELHVDDTARWLTALLAAHRAARVAHPDVPADDDGAVLRLIVTRWLHPHRVGQREPRT